jgi:hypothetical protein
MNRDRAHITGVSDLPTTGPTRTESAFADELNYCMASCSTLSELTDRARPFIVCA